MTFRNALQKSPLLKLCGSISLLALVALIVHFIVGPLGESRPLRVVVNDLINPLGILALLLITLKLFHSPFLKKSHLPAITKTVPLVIRVLQILIFLYLAAILFFLLSGPFAFNLPVTLGVNSADGPLFILILSSLLFVIIISPALAPDEERAQSLSLCHFPKIPMRLWLIVAMALLIRCWGISHGVAENIHHPDAQKQIMTTLHFLEGDYTYDIDHPVKQNRGTIGYPYFSLHMVEAVLRVQRLWGSFIGAPAPWPDNGAVVMTARVLNAFFAALMTLFIYRIAFLLDYRREAFWAAFLFAISTTSIQMSHYLGADLPMSFFALCAFYVGALNLRGERNRNYLFFGLLAGLSAACKYNGVLIFFFLGFIFLHLHPSRKEMLKHLPRMFLALSVAVLIFILTNINLMTSLTKGVVAIWVAMDYSAWYAMHDHTSASKLHWFATNWAYHHFVIASLFDPVPLWLAALLCVMALLRKAPLYLWGAPALIFLTGKWSMPISAASHYLLIVPFISLLLAIGIGEVTRRVGAIVGRLVGLVLIAGLTYVAVQDASFWSLTPLLAQTRDWINENVTPMGLSNHEVIIKSTYDGAPPLVLGYQLFAHHHYGTGRQAPTLHRDVHRWMFLKGEGSLDLLAPAPFVSSSARTIYPGSRELVTTSRVILTGGRWEGLSKEESRFIAREKPMKRMALWVRNMADRGNTVSFRIGSENFQFKLNPFETAPVTLVDDPTPSLLYNRALISTTVVSEGIAAWRLGVTEEEIGDLLLAVGRRDEAKAAYGRADTTMGRLRLMALSDDVMKQQRLREELLSRNPLLFSAQGEQWWGKAALFNDKPFAEKMIRPLIYRLGWSSKAERHTEMQGTHESVVWRINEGGSLYGPYIPLTAGWYEVAAHIERQKSSFHSFIFDVVSGVGRLPIMSKKVTATSLGENGEIHIPFEITDPVAFPVEMRFLSIEGGALTLSDITIRANPSRSVMEIVRRATAGR